jgi:DNA-binding IclR family transcriptional regulator
LDLEQLELIGRVLELVEMQVAVDHSVQRLHVGGVLSKHSTAGGRACDAAYMAAAERRWLTSTEASRNEAIASRTKPLQADHGV